MKKAKIKRPEVYSPRLRIALDPVYVQIANLGSSSTYNKYVSLVRELIKRGHYIYWCVPETDYLPDIVENHTQVAVIRTSYIQDQFVVDGMFTDEFMNLFNRVNGKYHVDAFCTSRTSMAWLYKRTLDPPRYHDQGGEDAMITDKSYGMPIVMIEEFPQTPERQFTSRGYWLANLLGYQVSDRTVFLSAHNRSEIVKAAYDTLNATEVARMQSKFRVIPAGIECAELDKLYQPDRWKVEEGFNVICVGRIFGPSYAEYLEYINYFYKGGDSDTSLTVSLSGALSGPMRKKLHRIGFDLKNNIGRQFHLKENNPRGNFLKELQKYKAFICPLSHLDHPTGLFECIYLGLPGVMPRSDYQESFFPDWPWVIDPKDKAQLLAHMAEIREDPAAARAKVLAWRDRIRTLYDAKHNIELLADEIELAARTNENRFRTSQGVINLASEMQGKKYSWGDVVTYLRKAGKMGVSIGDMTMRTTFTYGRSAIRHAMKMSGFVDDCRGPLEMFVRRDVFDADNVITAKDEPCPEALHNPTTAPSESPTASLRSQSKAKPPLAKPPSSGSSSKRLKRSVPR